MKCPLFVVLSLAPLACTGAAPARVAQATPIGTPAAVNLGAPPSPASAVSRAEATEAAEPKPGGASEAEEKAMFDLIGPVDRREADPFHDDHAWLDGGDGAGLDPFARPAGTGPRIGVRNASDVKPPSIQVGATTVAGRLPPEVVQRIVRRSFGRFRDCYKSALRGNPGLTGRIVVRFSIRPDGDVGFVGSAGSDLPDSTTIGCVAKVFAAMTFPQPESGKVDVVYPLVLQPGD